MHFQVASIQADCSNYKNEKMNKKFVFRIKSKISSPYHPYVVLHGDWLEGRVARGDLLTLVKGKARHPLRISAVCIAEGPGKLVLACGGAQESVRIAKTGDLLVACTSDDFKARLQAEVEAMTDKEYDDYLANQNSHHRRAQDALIRSLDFIEQAAQMRG
jgi:hypothetical protein